jgi:Uncharacterised nucleotidyltransferase
MESTTVEQLDGAALMAEGQTVVARMDAAGLPLRLLGGVAIALHCGGGAHRSFADLDTITTGKAARKVAAELAAAGYEPHVRFNAMHGDRRLAFDGPNGKLDVFVGRFEMCHRIDLDGRLTLESPTITATDLLLTKLQIVELNEKDVADAALLLRAHELGEGDGDHIDRVRMSAVTKDDWGLWRTMTGALTTIAGRAPNVAAKAVALAAVLEAAPKGRAFKLRARVGERKRWYSLPDEVG